MRRLLRFLPGMLLVTVWAGLGPAAAPDPVEELKEALRTPFAPLSADPDLRRKELKLQLDYRRDLLQKRVAALRVSDLRRALLLQEWRDQDRGDEDIRALDRSIRDQVIDRLRTSLGGLLQSGDPSLRAAGIAQIGELGVSVRGRGAAPLGRGLAADLAGAFADPLPAIRQDAARAFARIFPEAREVGKLVPLLQDPEPAVRRSAAEALAELARSIEPLTKSRASTEGDIFPSTAEAARVAAAVVEAAGSGLAQEMPAVRRACLEAHHQAARYLADKVLIDQIRRDFPPPDRPPTEREREAIQLFRQLVLFERDDLLPLARALGQSTPAVTGALADPRPENRLLAAQALVEIGTARLRLLRKAQSVPRLPPDKEKPEREKQEGAARNDPATAADAATARADREEARLRRRGEAPRAAPAQASPWQFTATVAASPRPDGAASARAASLLLQAGDPLDEDPLAQSLLAAIPALARSLDDPDAPLRRTVLDVLGTLARDKAIVAALPAIRRALADPDRFVRWSAARLAGHVGPVDPAATVPALVRLLADDDLDVQMAAANALGRLGLAAEPAVPALARQVAQGDVEARVEMIEALQAIGVPSAEAVSALTTALADTDERVRTAAANALRTFGPAGRPALLQLQQAARNDPSDAVRKAASDALLAVTAEKR